MLCCLKETSDSITSSVQRHLMQNHREARNLSLTADDMLLLSALAVIRSRAAHMVSSVEYAGAFQLSAATNRDFFEHQNALASFQAAVKFLGSEAFGRLTLQRRGPLPAPAVAPIRIDVDESLRRAERARAAAPGPVGVAPDVLRVSVPLVIDAKPRANVPAAGATAGSASSVAATKSRP